MKKRTIALLMAVVMLFGVTVGGTIAWLQDDTDPVVNTFTYGTIDIVLEETFNKDTDNDGTNDAWEKQMIPGSTIEKDPYVQVLEDSEDSWVFVKIEKSANFADFMTYEVDSNWTALEVNGTAVPNVYYYNTIVSAPSAELHVLANDKVVVLDTVTKEMMDAIKNGTASEPTLTFTAYAVQAENFDSAAEAWDATFGA